jgi:hypothetical protein
MSCGQWKQVYLLFPVDIYRLRLNIHMLWYFLSETQVTTFAHCYHFVFCNCKGNHTVHGVLLCIVTREKNTPLFGSAKRKNGGSYSLSAAPSLRTQ